MSSQRAKSGQPFKKFNTGTILNAGSSNTKFNNLSLETNNLADTTLYGSQILQSISPGASGNIGAYKPLSGGTFKYQTAGEYLIRGFSTKVSGTSNDVLKSGAADKGTRNAVHRWQSYQRAKLSSFDVITGEATYLSTGTVLASGINGVTGPRADEAALGWPHAPYELVYIDGSPDPIQDDINPPTSP